MFAGQDLSFFLKLWLDGSRCCYDVGKRRLGNGSQIKQFERKKKSDRWKCL